MPSPEAPRWPSASSAGTIAAGSGALRAEVIQPAMPPISGRLAQVDRTRHWLRRRLQPEAAVELLQLRERALRREAQPRGLARRGAEARAERAVGQQPAQLALEARLVAGRDQPAAYAVGDDFRDAA